MGASNDANTTSLRHRATIRCYHAGQACDRWGMVYRRREIGDKVQEETIFVISSHPPAVKTLAKFIRGHWAIENSEHWVLDVTFAEDASRIRKLSSPEISAAFRRMALNILQRDTTYKDSIRGKRLRAGWDDAILANIYTGFVAA